MREFVLVKFKCRVITDLYETVMCTALSGYK